VVGQALEIARDAEDFDDRVDGLEVNANHLFELLDELRVQVVDLVV
jgi:hypothetical protein